MGFFKLDDYVVPQGPAELKGHSLEFIHGQGCKACPLNAQKDLTTPHMDPFGTRRPFIYMLGEAPSEEDDRRGRHFAGEAGKALRMRIPRDWLPDMRWNYVVRTHDAATAQRAAEVTKRYKKAKNTKERRKVKWSAEGPPMIAVEACRPSIVKDIEETKPFAIFGFGAGPLRWALDETSISKWVGRYIPVKIGNHTCWYFPFIDPAEVVAKRRFTPRNSKSFGCDEEFLLALHLRRAFDIVEQLPDPVVHTEEQARANVEYVTGHKRGDLDKVLDFLDRCYAAPEFGMDYETSVLRPYYKRSRVLTVALSLEDKTFAFPLDHPRAGWSNADLRILEDEWAQFVHNAKGRRLIANAQYEAEWTAEFWGRRATQNGRWECTQSQAYILDERTYANGLDFLCMWHFGIRTKELYKVDRSDMESVDLETCLLYNGVDAKYHRLVYRVQHRLLKEQRLHGVYREHMKRVVASALTQTLGVPINEKQVEAYYTDLKGQADAIEKKIRALPEIEKWEKNPKLNKKGETFSLSANQHILGVLKLIGRGDVKSTEDKGLQKIDHPFARLVRRWRKPTKLLSTYITSIRRGSENLFPDGMLHPIYQTTKTRTWRTSSEEPNIQNWPKRGGDIYIRKVVTTPEDEIIVAIDYASIQARNVAMESEDPELTRVFKDNYDIHSDWLDRLFKAKPDWEPITFPIKPEWTPQERRKEFRNDVKNKFVFPCFFGAVGKTLAGYLGIEDKIAEDLRAAFFDKFREVERWHNECRKFYAQHGYITGLTGFRRRAPIEINQLINAPIQADETKIVCGAWHRLAMLDDPRMTPRWMVHDDLTFIWKRKHLDRNLDVAIPEMVRQTEPWMKRVPIEIEVAVGKTWNKLEAIGKFRSTDDGGWEELKK